MAFTAILGIAASEPGNVVPGLGASANNFVTFSGLYTLVPTKSSDTVFTSINYPSYTTAVLNIPNPYIETGLIGGMDSPQDQ